jgi:hypothetical protein
MEKNEKIAQEALKFLETAQNLEEQGFIEKAIENYQNAADYLKRSGFASETINEIYLRIEALRDFIKKETQYEHTQEMAKKEDLQEQAFIILDAAKNIESGGQIKDAIDQYMSAINLLIDAGWSEVQLEGIKDKIFGLTDRLGQITKKDQVQTQEGEEIPPQIGESVSPQVVGAFGKRKNAQKTDELLKFQQQKQKEEEIQNDAFAFMDNAKFYEDNKEYDKAIESYQNAIKLLKSIGWKQQTDQIEIIIDKLKKDKENHERTVKSESRITQEPKKPGPLVQASIKEFEQKQKSEEIQLEAFNLIDEGKKLEQEKRYDQAIEKFRKSVELLKSIQWDSYIQPVMNFISDVEEKKQNEQVVSQMKQKWENEAANIKDVVYIKEQEDLVKTGKEFERKKIEYAKHRKEQQEKENRFYDALSKADEALEKTFDFDTALIYYQKALDLLSGLGSGWDAYKDTLKTTISNITSLKEKNAQKELESIKKERAKSENEIEFQQQMNDLLDKERERIKSREVSLDLKRDEISYREERKEAAFNSLDEAMMYINQGDLDNAILAYQNAGSIFVGIEWIDELPLIENAIKELEHRKEMVKVQKLKELDQKFKVLKEEQESQKKIAAELKKEREKLFQKEIRIQEKEDEARYREERKSDAFEMLDAAQLRVNQGEYEEAIEYYQKAAIIMAEIQWTDEISSIQKAIIEVQNQKRDADLRKQRELQVQIEHNRLEIDFQNQISTQIKKQQEKLKQQEIIVRERDNELEFRENRKNEAFILLDEVENLMAIAKFDEALEKYHDVSNIFAQIGWKDEIPVIQSAINELESKRREKEAWKEKTMREALQREASYKHFMDQINRQKEIEMIKIQKELEQLEKTREKETQNLELRDKALKKIEDADELLKVENYDTAIDNYKQAIDILVSIGWSPAYLRLLNETLQFINVRKSEREAEKLKIVQVNEKRRQEEEKFQQQLKTSMDHEKERLRTKHVELKKRQDAAIEAERLKSEAFKVLDEALSLTEQQKFDDSIKKYRDAELMLNEINFSTEIIKDVIVEIRKKKTEYEEFKTKDLKALLKKEQEDLLFKQRMERAIKSEEQNLKNKQLKVKEEAERKNYLENRKNQAFKLLEKAENDFLNREYDESITSYRNAMMILGEINFPTNSLEEMINKVQEKQKEDLLATQKNLEISLRKANDEKLFLQQIANSIRREKDFIRQKDLEDKKKQRVDKFRESKSKEAFELLDDAQRKLDVEDFDGAITNYKKVKGIFEEIQWSSELPLIIESIFEIERRKKELELAKQKEIETQLLIKQQEEQFLKDLARQSQIERRNVERKQIEMKSQEKELEYLETRRIEAFELLDDALNSVNTGEYEQAKQLYYNVLRIFTEIQWHDELPLIQNAIREIDVRQREDQMRKVRELEEMIAQEQEEKEYNRFIEEKIKKEREILERKKIVVEEDIEAIEAQRVEAFKLLDRASLLLEDGKYDIAIDLYHQVAAIFAQIGWRDELPLIQHSIRDVESKRNEEALLRQRMIEEQIKIERENFEFLQNIKQQRELEDMNIKSRYAEVKKLEEKRAIDFQKQDDALKAIQNAESLINKSNYDMAKAQLVEGRKVLEEIGWSKDDLKLLDEEIVNIKARKELAEARQMEQEYLALKKKEEIEEFEQQIQQNLQKEKRRLKEKQIIASKHKDLVRYYENQKESAFGILSQAEILLHQGAYEESIQKYYNAEVILSEISFPTTIIRETINKIQEKLKERNKEKQRQLEAELKKEQEEREFKEMLAEQARQEKERLKVKESKLKKREDIKISHEKRKDDAFEQLALAESHLRNGNYDESLDSYRRAEIVLSAIGFPTDSIKETMMNVTELKNKSELDKYKDLETKLKKQQEEKEFQLRLAESMKREKERLSMKQITIKEQERIKKDLENKRMQAFSVLDEAKDNVNNGNYEKAIEAYRKALVLLQQIQFPTDAINSMILKITDLKREKEEEAELNKLTKLKEFEDERQFQLMIEERRRQEIARKRVQEQELKEREEQVRKQMEYRENAYNLLEEAGKYLKTMDPDFDKAISLYVEAKGILSQKIGWEPELNNLEGLIKDLEKQKNKYNERKRLEKERIIQKQKEYEKFKEEIKRTKAEYVKQKREQEKKLKQLEATKQYAENLKEEGLKLIDQGKQLAFKHEFNDSINKFNEAIKIFLEIGWEEQVKYIKKEIQNTKILEERVKNENLKIQKIKKDLDKKKKLERLKAEKYEQELKQTIDEVGGLTQEISNLIEGTQHELKERQKEKLRLTKLEAKEYRKNMGNLIKIKQDLKEELELVKQEKESAQEDYKLAKEKEKADEIKKLLKEVKKGKK